MTGVGVLVVILGDVRSRLPTRAWKEEGVLPYTRTDNGLR